jgi:pilus assembly protein Flp/PilA
VAIGLDGIKRAAAPQGEYHMFERFWKDESGQGLVEYALILFLVAIVVIAAVRTLGRKTNNVITNVHENLD